jgi:hypothetical protein
MRRLWIALALVRLYPRTWRIRYEAEVRALLADSPPSLRGLIDLLRGCGSEWARTLSDPVTYPHLSSTPHVLFQTTALIGGGLGVGLFAGAVGSWLRGIAAVPGDLTGIPFSMAVYMATVVRMLVALKSGPTRRRVGVLEARGWFAAIVVAFTLEEWGATRAQSDLDVLRAATAVWFLAAASAGNGRLMAARTALTAARLDEYRVRLRLQTAVRHARDAPGAMAELEAARADLAAVHGRIQEHAAVLRRVGPMAVLGLKAP